MQTYKEECLLVYPPFSTYGIKLYLFYHKDSLIANMPALLPFNKLFQPRIKWRKDCSRIRQIKPCYDNKPNNLYGKQKLIFVGRYFSKLAIISLFFHLLLFRFCLGDLKSFCLYGDIVLIANLTCALITCALFIVWLMLLLTSARFSAQR